MKKPKVLYFFALILATGIYPAKAAIFYFAQTGHWYEPVLVTNGITWPDAYAGAIARGGYLCTITNAAENTFAASLVNINYYSSPSINSDILGPWLGGYRNANNAQWQWVSGEPFSYTDWYSNQPDGYGGSDQKLQYYNRYTTGSTWGDHPGTPISGYSLPRGYIVEYNTSPLFIARTNDIATLSWSAAATNWVLETTPSLSPTSWSLVAMNQYKTNSSGFFLSFTNPVGTAFFRLRLNN